MQLKVKRLLGQQCCLQVSGHESISLLKSLVSEELKVPEDQTTLLFQGKVLDEDHRLSDYSIGPESVLYLAIKKPQLTPLNEPSKPTFAQAHSVWYQLSQVLENHFRTSDAIKVLERVVNDYYKSLGLLSLKNIEELARDILNPKETEAEITSEFPQQEKHPSQVPVAANRREQATQTEPQALLDG
uniref:Ubiquitin-like domain-containing protein n=1 Tax=Anolis carolinensis TaxID=28377 RepID=A0A803SP23_ANOCA